MTRAHPSPLPQTMTQNIIWLCIGLLAGPLLFLLALSLLPP